MLSANPSPMCLRDVYRINIFNVLSKPPLTVLQNDIVPAHLPLPHSPVLGEGPVFKAIASLPLQAVTGILILVPKLHGDLVVRESEQLLAQPVVLFLGPFGRQERHDLLAALDEVVAIAPDRVWRVGQADLFGVPTYGLDGAIVWMMRQKARWWARTECSKGLVLS